MKTAILSTGLVSRMICEEVEVEAQMEKSTVHKHHSRRLKNKVEGGND